jgi:hypothetical protein
MMMQMNIKEGIKRFRERVNEAILKELNQLHEKQALRQKKKEDMSYEEKEKSAQILYVLKREHDGSIKARGCADRRSQQEYTNKVDTSSPTCLWRQCC